MTVNEWRTKHKKCLYCEHLRYRWLDVPDFPEWYECVAKKKDIKHPNVQGIFCKCFELSKFNKKQDGVSHD